MAFAQAARRPIAGAVATLGVSDRVDFLRKTYGLLGVSLIAFAALTAGILKYMTQTSLRFSYWAMPHREIDAMGYAHTSGAWSWLVVIGLFMLTCYIGQRLAYSQTSRGLQLLGLGLSIVAEAVILQPLMWTLIVRFGNPEAIRVSGEGLLTGQAGAILTQAVIITLSIFIGLTLTVFITKKDFTFLRGALVIASFAVFGVIIAALIFGFNLGAVFCGAVILLMAGYILYETSLVMSQFPPTAFVGAALMLFSTIATLFWYVLRMLMMLNRR